MLIKRLMALFVMLLLAGPLAAQDRAETGGAQTLEDIMARQAAQEVDDAFRRDATGDPEAAAATKDQLGSLGGVSDAEVWRALRYDSADITVSAGGRVAETLVQSSGMEWTLFREGPLATYGGWTLLGTIGALILFFILRGRIGVDGGLAGRTVLRFKFVERFAHWILAGSFIVLGLTGLAILFGRAFIVPTFGHEANAAILRFSIFVHNNVSWAFMLALVMIFVMWVWHNLPSRLDLVWFAQAGGIVGSKHPPAKKFNAGQKLIFWSCIVFGGLISVTGLSLIFPFEIPVFAWVFGVLNATGLAELFGGALPTTLTPHAEMQLAQVLHAGFAFLLMAIIIAHIYIGSVGMEGASGAMTHGEVDEAWAKQHHSIWLEEMKEKERQPNATPAE
ncbi:formate dehydrogenase subunit gamma [Roseobacter sp. CCS2]|uniref:formate dehydrogenase subunit gamma n=1 Tax=Roseobacter sp. CCS2 TaxID=391593 RepID=UPI0000F40357|nr:formate dehydrogenase subunit gamma [Roseobacter sp. CCS2]EBA13951.1 Formate dehydrogenase, gamma subunit [Roseobacter sp. CCS2]